MPFTPTTRYEPNGDILAKGTFIWRERRNLLGLKVKRVHFRLDVDHIYSGPVLYIKVPAGYIYDGATIPRPLWWLFERFGLWLTAALYHDALYDQRVGSKVTADATMLEIMLDKGVNRLAAYAIFAAVLLWPGNWIYWSQRPKTAARVYRKR